MEMTATASAADFEEAVDDRQVVPRQERLRRAFRSDGDGLFRFILVRLGGDRHVAEELVQETCCAAACGRNLPDDDGDCAAWLRGIARNLIRRHYRDLKRRGVSVTLEDAQMSCKLVGTMESAPISEADAQRESWRQQLLLAVTSLPNEEQTLVFAYYFDGRSQADIAGELNASPKSIEARLYRIRQRLRDRLRNSERIESNE